MPPIASLEVPFQIAAHRLKMLLGIGLLVISSIECRCPAEEFRAARSVHLSYPAPDGLFFYNEMVVEQSVEGSYFMACGWDTGYFGVQQLDAHDHKVALFSVWDPTPGDDPNTVKSEERVKVLYQGEGVRIKRFGGEGTGGQCMWDFAWQLHQTNRFLVRAQVHAQETEYTAWIFARGSLETTRHLCDFY